MKELLRHGLWIVYLIFFQIFIFAVVIFQVRSPLPSNLEYDVDALRETPIQDSYAYLLECRQEALNVRLALIHQAKTSIALTSYAIYDGQARDVLYGALLSAAERGVTVRLVIDGFIEGRFMSDYQTTTYLMTHPNIEIRFFEPFSIWRPHAVQNRLHDKLLIIDEQYGIIGGRNIGDRYFLDTSNSVAVTYDRDVLIFGRPSSQAVQDMSMYFNELYNHPFSHREKPSEPSSSSEAVKQNLLEAHEDFIVAETLDLDSIMNHLHEAAIQTGTITFLRSPLNRMHKKPVIFNTLQQLAGAYEAFFVQTPYFIADRTMRAHFPNFSDVEVTVLTNSPITNPNLLAVAGYMSVRQSLAARTTLYEYHARSSIHAKTILMGDDITVIGSYNIDPRSVSLSTESVVVIHSVAFQSVVREAIEPLITSSLHITATETMNPYEIEIIEETRIRRVLRSVLQYVIRPFDYML